MKNKQQFYLLPEVNDFVSFQRRIFFACAKDPNKDEEGKSAVVIEDFLIGVKANGKHDDVTTPLIESSASLTTYKLWL